MVVEYVAETSGLGNAVTALAAVGVATVAAGVAAVKMAGDFEQGLTALQTGAGESAKNLAMVGDGIKKIAEDTGTSTKSLESAMFMVESSGAHGAAGLTELSIAAEGAKTDNADLTATTMALTGVMTDFHLPASDAAGAMNEIIASAKDGKMHMEDLASSLGAVLPVAENAGLKFADVGAAIAMMTNANIPAQQASQNLAFAIRSLDAPSGVAVKSLVSVGLSAQQVADTLRNQGLPAALQLIEDHVGKKFPESSVEWTTAMKNIMGGKAGLNVALAIGGKNLQDYEKDVNDVSGALKAGGTSVEGWSTVQGTFNNTMDRAKATIEVLAIDIGTKLLPIVSNIINTVMPVVSSFVTWATSGHAVSDMLTFFHQHAQIIIPVLSGLGAILLAVVIPAVWSLAAGVIAATWPFIAIGLAVAGLVAVFMHFYSTNAQFKTFIDGFVAGLRQAWTVISTNFIPVMEQIGNIIMTRVWPVLQGIGRFLVSTFAPVWKELVALWQTQLVPAFNEMAPYLPAIKTGLEGIAIIVGGILLIALAGIIGFIKGVITAFAAFLSGAMQAFGGIVQIVMGFVTFISGILAFIYDLVTGNWSKLGTDVAAIWHGIQNMVAGVCNVIMGIVGGFVMTVIGFFWGLVTGIIDFFRMLYDELVGHSIIPDMVNGIISWFEQLPGRAGAAIQSMISTILGLLNGLVTSALQIGANIVNNIAQGIRNAIGAVGSAINAVTQFISDHLPHSPAKIGPLMGLQEQGMEISNQVAKGMVNGVPLITSAMNNLAKPVTVGLKGVASASATPLQGGRQGDTYIQITMDGKDITNQVMKRVQKDLRGHGLKK